MNWVQLSGDLIAATIAVYALAFCFQAAGIAQRRTRRVTLKTSGAMIVAGNVASATDPAPEDGADKAGVGLIARMGTILLVLGFAINVLAVISRGVAAERAPWGNMYEFAIVGAASIAAAYVVGMRIYPIEGLGLWVSGLVLVILGCAVTILFTPTDALIPVLNSYWLAIHVGAAIVAGGAFTVGAIASIAYLVRGHRRPGTDRATLERVSYGLILFAFPVWTFAVIAGAVWAEAAWGRYWGWDPKETWAFITWVFYAAYLHAQSTAGWRGRKAAWLALLGYAAFLFNFVGVNMWVGGLHSYAGV